jgi:hypothetical protein
MEVVLSALLQELLEPDELEHKLPDYVPPTVQTWILRKFQEQTLDQVMRLPSATSTKRRRLL